MSFSYSKCIFNFLQLWLLNCLSSGTNTWRGWERSRWTCANTLIQKWGSNVLHQWLDVWHTNTFFFLRLDTDKRVPTHPPKKHEGMIIEIHYPCGIPAWCFFFFLGCVPGCFSTHIKGLVCMGFEEEMQNRGMNWLCTFPTPSQQVVQDVTHTMASCSLSGSSCSMHLRQPPQKRHVISMRALHQTNAGFAGGCLISPGFVDSCHPPKNLLATSRGVAAVFGLL